MNSHPSSILVEDQRIADQFFLQTSPISFSPGFSFEGTTPTSFSSEIADEEMKEILGGSTSFTTLSPFSPSETGSTTFEQLHLSPDQNQSYDQEKLFTPQQSLHQSTVHYEDGSFEHQFLMSDCITGSATRVISSFYQHHNAGTVRLNHGSFGAPPKPVLQCAEEFRLRWLQQPDLVYLNSLESEILDSR